MPDANFAFNPEGDVKCPLKANHTQNPKLLKRVEANGMDPSPL